MEDTLTSRFKSACDLFAVRFNIPPKSANFFFLQIQLTPNPVSEMTTLEGRIRAMGYYFEQDQKEVTTFIDQIQNESVKNQ